MWNCGRKRRRTKRTQIDFLCGTNAIHGCALPVSPPHICFKKSDHRPILGALSIPSPQVRLDPRTKSLRGRFPESALDSVQFKGACVNMGSGSMSSLQTDIFNCAKRIGYTPAGGRAAAQCRCARAAVSSTQGE